MTVSPRPADRRRTTPVSIGPSTGRARLWAYAANPHVIFALAALGHAALVLIVQHYRAPVLWENGVIASYLWRGEGFRTDFARPAELSSWQAPGYPVLLLAAWRVFDHGPAPYLALSLVQAVALASIVYPVSGLAARWFDDRTRIAAAWLTLLMPLYAWYSTRLHQAGLAMVAHAWLLFLWLRLRDGLTASPTTVSARVTPARVTIRAAATGALTGLAALLQPTVLGVLAPLGVWQLASALRRRDRRAAARWLFCAGCVLLVLLPWTIRNYRVHHTLVPIRNNFGKEFWMGNNPHATGAGFAAGGREEITIAHPPRAFGRRPALSEMALMDAMLAEGWDDVRADPAAFVGRTLRKIGWFWTVLPRDLVRTVAGDEAVRYRGVYVGYWTLIVAAGAIALVRVRPLPRESLAVLALYITVYSLLYGVTHVGQVRYRGEIEFVFLPLAAAGLVSLLPAARAGRREPA